jgi:hypothetical protein
MSKSTLAGIGAINVRFAAECMVISKGDVIVDAVIESRTAKEIIVVGENVQASVNVNSFLQALVDGSRLPLIIGETIVYAVGKNYIFTKAVPYTFYSNIYSVALRGGSEASVYDTQFYTSIHADIEKALAAINKLSQQNPEVYSKPKIQFMSRMIQYGIEMGKMAPQPFTVIPESANVLNILTKTKKKDDTVALMATLDGTIASTMYYDEALEPKIKITQNGNLKELKIATMTVDAFIRRVLVDHLQFIRILTKFVKVFTTTQDVKSSMTLWNMYFRLNDMRTKKPGSSDQKPGSIDQKPSNTQ